jgi:hypothetical protein
MTSWKKDYECLINVNSDEVPDIFGESIIRDPVPVCLEKLT